MNAGWTSREDARSFTTLLVEVMVSLEREEEGAEDETTAGTAVYADDDRGGVEDILGSLVSSLLSMELILLNELDRPGAMATPTSPLDWDAEWRVFA